MAREAHTQSASTEGTFSSEEVAHLLGLGSRQAVHERLRQGALLGMHGVERGLHFPREQFPDGGRVVKGLAELQRLRGAGQATRAWLDTPCDSLDGRRPVELLREEPVEPVLVAAQSASRGDFGRRAAMPALHSTGGWSTNRFGRRVAVREFGAAEFEARSIVCLSGEADARFALLDLRDGGSVRIGAPSAVIGDCRLRAGQTPGAALHSLVPEGELSMTPLAIRCGGSIGTCTVRTRRSVIVGEVTCGDGGGGVGPVSHVPPPPLVTVRRLAFVYRRGQVATATRSSRPRLASGERNALLKKSIATRTLPGTKRVLG